VTEQQPDAQDEPTPETAETVSEPATGAEAPDATAPEAAAPDAPEPATSEPSGPSETDPGRSRPVGPKILGVAAEPKPVKIVKKRLQEKPKREPLPWPELRTAVRTVGDDLDVNELKELFRSFPVSLREEVTENVRGFQKGARRPVSQHAAKQLARASHTARRMKRNARPSAEVAEALGQAMAAERIASLEPEKAAEVILPKRDLLERESRQAQRVARDAETRERDEARRKKREDQKANRQQTTFGDGFSGAKIQGLDALSSLFGTAEPGPDAEAQQSQE
jgi:hypothetical protein